MALCAARTISIMKQLSTGVSAKAMTVMKILPSELGVDSVEWRPLLEVFSDDLPSPQLWEMEVTRWKSQMTQRQELSTIAQTLPHCDRDIYPNIARMLEIAATWPVTTCECERTFSCMRRLNTYLRATQTVDRYDALAMIHIHRDREVDIDRVINTFARLHPRRMELATIL